jgi:uncharacterized protein (TIGR03083 family)
MSELALAAPVDAIDVMVDERRLLLELLEGLKPAEWDQPTECPAWRVKGIALHLVADDLSLLSRQRDDEPPGVVPTVEDPGWEGLFGELNRFNERWVETAGFLSPPVVVDLLRSTGEWTHRWYTTVDPERLGEGVHWAGIDAAPYWMLAAREYLERWIHQQQIRRATGRPGLDDPRYVVPTVAVTVRGFPPALSLFPAEVGTAVSLQLEGTDRAWTFVNGGSSWMIHDGMPASPDVRLTLDVPAASALFSRGLEHAAATECLRAEGDEKLAAPLAAGVAAFFAR